MTQCEEFEVRSAFKALDDWKASANAPTYDAAFIAGARWQAAKPVQPSQVQGPEPIWEVQREDSKNLEWMATLPAGTKLFAAINTKTV